MQSGGGCDIHALQGKMLGKPLRARYIEPYLPDSGSVGEYFGGRSQGEYLSGIQDEYAIA